MPDFPSEAKIHFLALFSNFWLEAADRLSPKQANSHSRFDVKEMQSITFGGS